MTAGSCDSAMSMKLASMFQVMKPQPTRVPAAAVSSRLSHSLFP
jgi:hypothetical protein